MILWFSSRFQWVKLKSILPRYCDGFDHFRNVDYFPHLDESWNPEKLHSSFYNMSVFTRDNLRPTDNIVSQLVLAVLHRDPSDNGNFGNETLSGWCQLGFYWQRGMGVFPQKGTIWIHSQRIVVVCFDPPEALRGFDTGVYLPFFWQTWDFLRAGTAFQATLAKNN